MATHRMLPPSNIPQRTLTANGRAYSGTPGNVYDVLDADAAVLAANGWIDCGQSCATGSRPSSGVPPNAYPLFVGAAYIDTSQNVVARWDGATWRNVITGASV